MQCLHESLVFIHFWSQKNAVPVVEHVNPNLKERVKKSSRYSCSGWIYTSHTGRRFHSTPLFNLHVIEMLQWAACFFGRGFRTSFSPACIQFNPLISLWICVYLAYTSTLSVLVWSHVICHMLAHRNWIPPLLTYILCRGLRELMKKIRSSPTGVDTSLSRTDPWSCFDPSDTSLNWIEKHPAVVMNPTNNEISHKTNKLRQVSTLRKAFIFI